MALPGKYTVSMDKVVDGEITELVGPQEFLCKTLGMATLPAEDKEAMLAFQQEVSEFSRIVRGTGSYLGELSDKLNLMAVAAKDASKVDSETLSEIRAVEKELAGIKIKLSGDQSLANRSYPVAPSISDRVGLIIYGLWETSSAPTSTMSQSLDIARRQFDEIYPIIKKLDEQKIPALEEKLEKSGAPYTPGRLPEWK
jgi:hypothetical protein